jgi:TetR/AcrR family transcriptional regulator
VNDPLTLRSSDRILYEALHIFSQKGYDATSVREICEAAAITKPTLYHFYGSKEGLYRALVDGTFEQFRATLVSVLAEPGTASRKLCRVARLYFEVARESRELMRFLFSLVHNPPSSAPPVDIPKLYEQVVGLVADEIEQGVLRGELRPGPTDLRMLVFMGTLGEAVVGYLVAGRPEPTPELADRLVDTILQDWQRS